jgi:hypothetical protein
MKKLLTSDVRNHAVLGIDTVGGDCVEHWIPAAFQAVWEELIDVTDVC